MYELNEGIGGGEACELRYRGAQVSILLKETKVCLLPQQNSVTPHDPKMDNCYKTVFFLIKKKII